MKLGIGLPTWHGSAATGRDVLDWARRVEDAGFHAVAVHDRPFHDTWDPLAALAAVAAVTERVRLVTGALLLPMRDEALVAKQAAVIDRVSNGRLDLGVALGARPEDFGLFGKTPAGRGRIFEKQLERMTQLWADAQATVDTGEAAGPASIQQPGPALWVGGYSPAAIGRAMRWGQGYILGAPGVEMIRGRVPEVRKAAEEAGRSPFPIAALAYVLPGSTPEELAEGERLLLRYYGSLRKPFVEMVHTGTSEDVLGTVQAYRDAGVDVLHMIIVSRDPAKIDLLARDVLPNVGG